MSGQFKAVAIPLPTESDVEVTEKKEQEISDAKETRRVSVHEMPIGATKPASLPPVISTQPPERERSPEKAEALLNLTEAEKKASKSSYAFAFDNMVEANLGLTKSVNRLVALSYVIQGTQLLVLLVILIRELLIKR